MRLYVVLLFRFSLRGRLKPNFIYMNMFFLIHSATKVDHAFFVYYWSLRLFLLYRCAGLIFKYFHNSRLIEILFIFSFNTLSPLHKRWLILVFNWIWTGLFFNWRPLSFRLAFGSLSLILLSLQKMKKMRSGLTFFYLFGN